MTSYDKGVIYGLQLAQDKANERSHQAMAAGQTHVANAMAELSTDILLDRKHVEGDHQFCEHQ